MHRQPATHPRGRVALYAVLLLAIIGLTACSQACTQAAIVGDYTLRSGSDTYGLSLSNSGTGTFYINGKMVERLSWERWSGNEQIFIHVSHGVLDRLDALTGDAIPAAAANFRGAYFGLTPECKSGSAKKLAIGVDDTVAFSRAH